MGVWLEVSESEIGAGVQIVSIRSRSPSPNCEDSFAYRSVIFRSLCPRILKITNCRPIDCLADNEPSGGERKPERSFTIFVHGIGPGDAISLETSAEVFIAGLGRGRKRSGPLRPPPVPQPERSARHGERLSSAGCCTCAPDTSAAVRLREPSGVRRHRTP
jgi:hypothetical protein